LRRPSQARQNEVQRFLRHVEEWAKTRKNLAAVALVGSWARGSARDDSDVDLVVLSETEDDVGSLSSRPARSSSAAATGPGYRAPTPAASGLEVEVGIATQSWAATDPVDAGTRRVVADGLRALYDPQRLLAELACALR